MVVKMVFDQLLSRSSVTLLKSGSKDEAFEELVTVLCRNNPELDSKRILDEVWKREQLVTTQVAPGIAIPTRRCRSGKP